MTRLPDGAVLLHVGPFKTGTTALQGAFREGREAAAAQGVHLVGEPGLMIPAAMAVAEGASLADRDAGAGLEAWARVVAEVEESTARQTVVSSEFFSPAPVERARRILADLGRERTHVVITLRPLSLILASQWQQYAQNRPIARPGDELDFEEWLRVVLTDPQQERVTPTFWRRHRHDELVRRWVEAAGPERVTVVVADPARPQTLLRAFEELTGLREETLALPPRGGNRSLTAAEVALVRAFNRRWQERGRDAADYTRYVRFGAIRSLLSRAPGSAEERVLTPAWAVARATALGTEMAEAIAASGARVVGDLGRLGDSALAPAVGENAADPEVPEEVWRRFLAGLLLHLGRTGSRPATGQRQPGPLERGLQARRWVLHEELDDLRWRVGHVAEQVRQARPVGELSRAALLAEAARRLARRPRPGGASGAS